MPSARLTSREAADLLGVRLQTVYAYASRGLLRSARAPGGRGSTFDRVEVEALRARGGRGRAPSGPRVAAWQGPVVDTDVTVVRDGRPALRGVDLVALAEHARLESVAGWLWTGEPGQRLSAPAGPLAAARAAVAALPAGLLTDRLRVAVAAAAAADPLRFDVRPAAVVEAAGGLLATMVDALPALGPQPRAADLGRRLWSRLTPARADAGLLAVLDRALVLLVDHDLAVSTVAARTAASVRANVHAVVQAALATMEGPLHGGASTLAVPVLRAALDGSPVEVVAAHRRAGRALPGFGHRLYPDGDPRGRALLDALAGTPRGRRAARAAADLAAAAAEHPNVDLGLAALTVAAGMPDEAGEVVFGIARTAGWVAHALEEYDEAPLRFRGHGHYRGPQPPQPLPW